MKKTLMLFFSALLLTNTIVAQSSKNESEDYKVSLGARLNIAFGPSVKAFVSEKGAVEGTAYLGKGVTIINALYQHHAKLDWTPGLKWYFGGGGNAILYKNSIVEDGGANFGLVGCIGFDYKLPKAPLNISLDYQPYFGLSNGIGFVGSFYGGLAVRYVLK